MEEECPKCPQGLPPWLATFADLMSLLMCFFVLLLSFAEIDAIRFKKMAESMKDAFGVQREIPAPDIVKGVSVIKQEWSPSITDPAIISEIRQETSPVERENVQMNDDEVMESAQDLLEREMEAQAEVLKEALRDEIVQGTVTVETEGAKIILRIREQGSFRSGSANLNPGFFDVMDRISKVLQDTPGDIVVAGHTDNIPIRTGRFRSNWELSSARAVTVVHAMLRNPQIDPDRVLIEGWADTKPLVPNDTPENRAQNRRVELLVRRGKDDELGDLTP